LAEKMPDLKNLRYLSFNSNDLGQGFATNMTKKIPKAPGAITTGFLSKVVQQGGIEDLAQGIRKIKSIEGLIFIDCSLGPLEMQSLGETFKELPNLRVLYLSKNHFASDGGQALAHALSHCSDLRDLNLESCALGPHEAEAIAKVLPRLRNLEELDLSNNRLGSEGIKALFRPLAGLKHLKFLNLSENDLNPEDEEMIGKALADLPHLELIL